MAQRNRRFLPVHMAFHPGAFKHPNTSIFSDSVTFDTHFIRDHKKIQLFWDIFGHLSFPLRQNLDRQLTDELKAKSPKRFQFTAKKNWPNKQWPTIQQWVSSLNPKFWNPNFFFPQWTAMSISWVRVVGAGRWSPWWWVVGGAVVQTGVS